MKLKLKEEQWQNKFLNKGTASGLGDLSMMIGTVSDIIHQTRKERDAEIREIVLEKLCNQ